MTFYECIIPGIGMMDQPTVFLSYKRLRDNFCIRQHSSQLQCADDLKAGKRQVRRNEFQVKQSLMQHGKNWEFESEYGIQAEIFMNQARLRSMA